MTVGPPWLVLARIIWYKSARGGSFANRIWCKYQGGSRPWECDGHYDRSVAIDKAVSATVPIATNKCLPEASTRSTGRVAYRHTMVQCHYRQLHSQARSIPTKFS